MLLLAKINAVQNEFLMNQVASNDFSKYQIQAFIFELMLSITGEFISV